MCKKIFILTILLSAITFTVTAAELNPRDDENLILFYHRQGYENYLLKNSLRVDKKNSLQVISFDYIIYDGIQPENTRRDKKSHMAFAYDEVARKVYFTDDKGELIFLNPGGTVSEGSDYAISADIVYGAVFGKRFYVCPTYLDAEKNYILFADLGIHGAGLYIDRKSLNVIQEDDGGCIISIDEVQVPDANFGKTAIANRYTHHYSYVYGKNVVMRFVDEEDKWVKVNPDITDTEDENFTYDARIAEAAYYLAFGKKFYGIFEKDFYKNFNVKS